MNIDANTVDVRADVGGGQVMPSRPSMLSLRRAGPLLAVASFAVLLSGCTTAPERELSTRASPYAVLVDGKNPVKPDEFMDTPEAIYSAEEDLFRYYERQRGHALNVLQLSGGGQNGAFGAGLLKGWSESGTRPEFDIVTGVSTGALLATHAFLGTPADDAVLEEIFTQITADDVFTSEGVFGVLGGSPSLLDTAPLAALLEKHITEEVLARVAAAHAEGRRLLVGTTNLDYNRTWAWNLGSLAKQGGPDTVARYRQILMASSAFPIMFPPVEIDGHLFADGAVRANILVLGLSGEDPPGPPLYGPGNFYVVQNGRLDIPPGPVRASLPALAGTTIGEMMASSTAGLLMRSYFAAKVHGYDYHTIEVPKGVDIGKNPLAFDQQQMRAGFDAGYRLGKTPGSWSDVPPLLGDMPEWMVEVIREKF